MQLGSAVDLEVKEQRDDGSGVVAVPILPESEIDLSRTASGGKGKVTIDAAVLDQIVANFAAWDKPVPVGFFGHEEDRSGPQTGFVEGLKRRGAMLWATMDLNAWAFGMVVLERAFRGFSVEIQKDLKTPTSELEGWVLTGGTFTNRPATDVNFKIAAEGESSSDATATAHVTIRPKVEEGATMPEGNASAKQAEKTVSLTFHEEKVNTVKAALETANGTVATLEARCESLKADAAKHKADVVELSAKVESLAVDRDTHRSAAARAEIQLKGLREAKQVLETSLNETAEKLSEQRNANLSIEVEKVVVEAVKAGVPPAIFDGHEANPGEWMESKFVNLEAFKDTISNIRGVGVKLGSAPVKSGHDPAKNADPKEAVPEKDQAVLDRLGLSTDFDGVTTLAEAKARHKAALAAKE